MAPFSMPGLVLGAGDSEMVRIQPTLISQDIGTDARENTQSNKISPCEDLKQDLCNKVLWFYTERNDYSARSE